MAEKVEEPKVDEEAKAPEEDEVESGKMTFLEHLDELRKRLLRIVTYILVGMLACFYFSRDIYNFISVPMKKVLPPGRNFAYTNPTDPFTVYVKVALIAGIFLTIPFCLYEVWKFIAPGLYRRERRYVLPFMFSTIVCFLAGGAFCYYIVLPNAFAFFVNLGRDWDPVIRVDEYLDLTNMMLLGFGLVFEMPVIVAFLSMFGLVTARFLWSKIQYAVVAIVVLASILSPTGDAFNLLLWSGPMVLLYLLSIGIAALFGWQRKRKGLV